MPAATKLLSLENIFVARNNTCLLRQFVLLVTTPANDTREPHLDVSPKCFTIATIALLSASEQVHRALVQKYFVCCV